MDMLTLELFDVPVSRALIEVQHALERHPDLSLRVLLEGDETVLHNLQRFLGRQGRRGVTSTVGSVWQVDIPPAPRPVQPPPVREFRRDAPRPILVLRSAFAPGDRALGRRLLLGLLRTVEPPTPWIGLGHEALELLDDPQALEILEGLKARGILVRLSRESLAFARRDPGPFEVMEDSEWQTCVARGTATLL